MVQELGDDSDESIGKDSQENKRNANDGEEEVKQSKSEDNQMIRDDDSKKLELQLQEQDHKI